MKVWGERRRSALYIGCVYMLIVQALLLWTAVIGGLVEKGQVVLLGDFNARVGRSVEVDDVIGIFGEDTCNASVYRLISFLNEVELVVCNGRKLVVEPEWARVRPSLKQKSIIDYVITDAQLMAVSGNVHVDTADIGCSDHFLVWVELGRAAKNSKKGKRVIRSGRLDRFGDDEVKLRYQNGLRDEVHGFSESIKRKVEWGMKGHDLVNEVLRKWESISFKEGSWGQDD